MMRFSYLPPLMVYLAAGVSGLTGIVGVFFVKEYLGLSAEFASLVSALLNPTALPITPSATPAATPTPTITPPVLCCHTAPEGMQDVSAVVVDIAVIDPKSRLLVTDAQLARLNGADGQSQGPALIDWGNTTCAGCPIQTQWQSTPGLLLAQWRAALDANTIGLPRPAISGIRVYERYLYLSPPNLQTP